jgi:hypothetical protein
MLCTQHILDRYRCFVNLIKFFTSVLTLVTTLNKQNARLLPGLKINYRSVSECVRACACANKTAKTGGTGRIFGTAASIFCYVTVFNKVHRWLKRTESFFLVLSQYFNSVSLINLQSSNQTYVELRNAIVRLHPQVQHSHHAEIPIQYS